MSLHAAQKDDLVLWTKDLSIGIEEVDDQHQYLIDRINRLWRALLEKRADGEVVWLIEDLHKYTQTHFVAEEALMRSFDYPKLEEHKRSHRNFEDYIRTAADEMIAGKPITMDLLHFLNDWLQKHIKVTDQDYARYVDRKRHGGFLSSFSSLFRTFNAIGKAKEETKPEMGLHGLDMQKAIELHVDWGRRLKEMVDGAGPAVGWEEAVRDDVCMLGSWLNANEQDALGKLDEFKRLQKDHAAFHAHAGKVVALHGSGKGQDAKTELRSEFRGHSNQVRLDIIQLYAAWHRGR